MNPQRAAENSCPDRVSFPSDETAGIGRQLLPDHGLMRTSQGSAAALGKFEVDGVRVALSRISSVVERLINRASVVNCDVRLLPDHA